MIRPPEGRCPTAKCSIVILKSTAPPGLSLNLGAEVKKILLVYFERHARRVLLEFPRTLNNSILSTAYKKRAGPAMNPRGGGIRWGTNCHEGGRKEVRNTEPPQAGMRAFDCNITHLPAVDDR